MITRTFAKRADFRILGSEAAYNANAGRLMLKILCRLPFLTLSANITPVTIMWKTNLG